jgi:hypothetical protein
MQNDLIIFEFSNEDAREVLLPPSLVGELADQLTWLLDTIINEIEPDGGRARRFTLYLAAVERGSVRIGFKQVLGLEKLTLLEKLQATQAGLTIVGLVGAGLVWAGIQTGYFVPVQPDGAKRTRVLIQAHTRALSRPELRKGIEGLAHMALRAGADSVTIIVPDQPACTLFDASTHPSFLGTGGRALPKESLGHLEGELQLTVDKIRVRDRNGEKEMYVGSLVVPDTTKGPRGVTKTGTQTIVVLVDWQSKRPPPAVGEKAVIIRGTLSPHELEVIEALEPIRKEHRQVSGLLVVTSMRLYE